MLKHFARDLCTSTSTILELTSGSDGAEHHVARQFYFTKSCQASHDMRKLQIYKSKSACKKDLQCLSWASLHDKVKSPCHELLE